RRVLVITLQIAERGFAGELARELERAAALQSPTRRVALQAKAIHRDIVLARIGRDFEERLEAWHQIVTRAQRAAEAIVIAVGVAARGAVGKRGILVLGAFGGSLGGDLDAVEALRDACRATERREDRKA